MKKIKVGILGATGMVGQRFVSLLAYHPWFDVNVIAASSQSRGKTYREAVAHRWEMDVPIPDHIAEETLLSVEEDREKIVSRVDLVFCAVALEKEKIKALESWYAAHGVMVVSNNSAHRFTPDVPMVIPEVNGDHLEILLHQRRHHGWKKGGIVVKSNCSLQSYVPALDPLKRFGIEKVVVTTLQAISGAGKTFTTWPEMVDNVIPFIGGEEEKSEREPLKIWGNIKEGEIIPVPKPIITATCIRVPVSNGHMASVAVQFTKKPSLEEVIAIWEHYENPLKTFHLPSSPKRFITYFTEENRPQTRLDRDLENGMGISVGRLRNDTVLDFKFVCLSHNTIRGAAGGAVLLAELLVAKGYIF
jgi:aspartate-semialdehyde dehydrogenase